jgi:diguanylate cyclase (GGDEF)-like protein/PAS domain S-box-containing protein
MKERLFRAYLAGGALVAVAYFLLPDGPGLIVWDALALSMPVAIVVGVRRFEPDRRRPWLFLAAGLGAFVIGDIIWSPPIGNSLGPSDLAYVVGYPLIAVGCLLLARVGKRTLRLAMIDSLIGAVGLAVILWVVVLGHSVDTGPTFASLVNVAYPVFDIFIVTLLARLALAHRSREPAQWWLVIGFTTMLVTDLIYAWLVQHSADPYSLFLDLGWLISYVSIGAAALHSSMVHLTRRDAPEAMLTPTDVLWLGVPLLAVPVLILLPGDDQAIDHVILGTAAIALAILVMFRIVLSAKDQDRARQQARTAELEYRAVFESSPAAVLKVSHAEEILDANPAAERLFGYAEGLRGRSARALLVDPGADAERIASAIAALADQSGRGHAAWTVRMYRGDGSTFWSAMNTSLVVDAHGAPLFGITSVEDVTVKRDEDERLRFRALHDPLTGLPNRDLLAENLRRSLARARRRGSALAVMFLDLDGFKTVNDRLGHAVGDDLLKALAHRLETATRGGDMVARLGGDEFVMVVEDVRSTDEAEAVTARFLEEVRRPVVIGGERISLDASIGLVVAEANDAPDDILRRADSAMYEAKRAGRGGWRRFEGRIAAGEAG